MAVKTPHILLAASNTRKMLENLRNVLDVGACDAIEQEINKNVISLFELGEEHFRFAQGIERRVWRQRMSRLYYGAYNVRRAIVLHFKENIILTSLITKILVISLTLSLIKISTGRG